MEYNLTSSQKIFYTKDFDNSIWTQGVIQIFPKVYSYRELNDAFNKLVKNNDSLLVRMKENTDPVIMVLEEFEYTEFPYIQCETEDEVYKAFYEYLKTPADVFKRPVTCMIFSTPVSSGIMVNSHHIVVDGYSAFVMAKRINSYLNNTELENIAYESYEDYTDKESKYKSSKRYLSDRKYWLEQFESKPQSQILPTAGEVFNYESSEEDYFIPNELFIRIKNICDNNDISLGSFFNTIYATYFFRKYDVDNFTIGVPVLNRTTQVELNTIGLYMNLVPLVINLNPSEKFFDIARRIEDSQMNLFRHQRFSQYDISELLKDRGYERLFDIAADYEEFELNVDYRMEICYSKAISVPVEIHFFNTNDARRKLKIRYRTSIFSQRDIRTMLGSIIAIAEDIIINPDKNITELETASNQDKQKLIATFNDTTSDYAKDKCIHELFEAQVVKSPDKVALIATDKKLTYKELNEEANKIAHSLMEKGIGKGDIVGLMLPRKSYLLSALFGILKTGAAYLPIDSELPAERIEYMCKDTNAKLVISAENIESLLRNDNISNPCVEMTNDSVCYCIYTSGSTGQPKGVMAMHRNVVNYISKSKHNIAGKVITDDFEAIVSISTCSFDIFVTETVLPLVNGLHSILADEEQCRNQYALNKLLSREKGEFLQTTPTKFKVLTAEPSQRDFLKNIKAILLGGEAMEESYLKQLRELTDAKIYNIYGATEVPIWSTFADTETFTDNITIGRPIANTQVYILDKYLKPVPIGVTGELCIAGDSVSAGYLNRPELTAEKFVDNPFGEGKMYRTGDNAYWREDGNLGYVGRSDFQVKIRGLRIELGEIESAIQAVDGIDRAVVVVRKDKEERQLICAFYTGDDKGAKILRSEIGKSLPKYMIPHIFTHLDKMPLTSSGKANRNALPEIDLENISTDTEYVAPETEKEAILSECICDVLGIEKVSVLDNFFDIGGDSLKSIELTAKLEEKGYTAAIRTIFSSKDIRELADKLEEKTADKKKIEYGKVIPATAAQMRVYTAQMLDPDSTMYNITYAFKTSDIDKNRLEKAINKLIERHESLRTHFESRDGEIVQVIDDSAVISVEDITDIEGFVKAFNLGASPLVHAGSTDDTIVISLHHISVDGESMPVFFKELNELYMGRDLIDTVQYGEFAVTDSYSKENESYWTDIFSEEVSELNLPADYQRGAVQSFNGRNIYEQIDITLHDKIEEKCKEKGITPYVYYMACFSVLLSKLSGNEDIIVGTPISGRQSRYLSTVGMFVNTVALRSRPEGNKKFSDLLTEIRDSSINAIDNQNYPFGELVKKLGIHSSGHNPLFDVMFAYQSFEMTDISFGDKKAELIPLGTSAAKCDITFNILPRTDDVVLAIEYCSDLFKAEKISAFAEMYTTLLEQCLDDSKLIRDISVADMKTIEKFNDTAHTYDIPEDSTLYSLFEKAANENKNKLCIKTAEKNLTFGELLNISEALDSKIRNITDVQKSVIAIIAERSAEMYSAIYGIIRGGNAYLPIDPDYPQERIDFILKNSGAKAVAVQGKFAELASNIPCINVTEIIKKPENSGADKCLATPDDTAYVIYTSGSTGTPKGAKVSHKSAVNRILWMHDKYPLCADDVILQKTPYTFDVSVWEHFWWGICGGCLAASKPGEHFLPAKILEEVELNKVTHLHFVPSVFELFLNYLEAHTDEISKFDSVKYVFLSGEALTSNLVQRFYRLYDYEKVSLHNLYGPTECAVDVTYYDCKPDDIDPVPIGKPIYNTQIHIVDKYLSPVPIGVTGELCIAGTNVGQGYLNNPELTAEKFVDNPFGEGKLYRTGDNAYWREDGNIVFVGRSDFQVKINGQRIETGEIEAVISNVSGVESCVVLVRKLNNRDTLVAFYCGKAELEIKIKDICREKLPKYMIPSFVLQIDAMPLNQSGKLDRKALSDRDITIYQSEADAPICDTERYICEVFEEVLGEKNIGRNSDFFEYGGTSYSMISLLSNDGFESITAAEFMKNPTPALLALLLERKPIIETKYLEDLFVPEDYEKALILLPFAGGGAEAYSNLVSSLKKADSRTAIYFIRYLHSFEECKEAADEIAEFFKDKSIMFYSHCVGSAITLNIISCLEGKNIPVNHYFAGASIPPAKPTRNNIWNKVSDKVLTTILSKAGSELRNLPADKQAELLVKFRKDTDFANIGFSDFGGKIKTPTTLILSKKDLFTLHYKKAEENWKKYVKTISAIKYVDSNSHYFQSENSDMVAKIIFK